MSGAIRVVVVDHSQCISRLLVAYRDHAPDVQLVGNALSGSRALGLVKTRRPDVVILNLDMPEIESLAVLDHIMHERPTPVVLVSSANAQTVEFAMAAVKMGAVDVLRTDTPEFAANATALCRVMVQKIRAAARIRVVRSLRSRQAHGRVVAPVGSPTAVPDNSDRCPPHHAGGPEGVVVIGASTGGPTALRELLGELPADFPAAILIVQHLPETFTAALATQLDRYTAITVREAAEGDRLRPGLALVAPGGVHLRLTTEARVQLTREPAVGGHRPSIDVTMQSVAAVYGARAWGVILTGMGADGVLGMVAIHAQGGTTFAQDAASCVVDGMPQQTRATGIVDYVDTPAQLARRLAITPWKPRRHKTW
jgi:two-component system, chemotaxis family, protein-glutamate methylesterase/glutaminase